MVKNGYPFNGSNGHINNNANEHDIDGIKPTYALEHLATFKLKNDSEIARPKDKLKKLMELDKVGGVWPMKMYMCFNGQWLVMLDGDMKEIENFPGSLITEPTAFISEDPMEIYNNILIFTVPGISLGMTEMHLFQVTDVSAIHMVEDLKTLASGKLVTNDRNKTPIKLPKSERPMQNGKDQYGIAMAAAEIAKNAHDQEQTTKDIQVLNHCFEDIERFVSRLQFAAEALRELEVRKYEHNTHGEGLLHNRSRPPTENEFHDIFAKHKLAFNYVNKLQKHFEDPAEPIHNSFVSLQTIYFVCNDVYVGARVAENVVEPLLRKETVTFLKSCLNEKELQLWQSLGTNWTKSKDQFHDPKAAYHPTFYDEWSPEWVVDEDVPYVAPPSIMKKQQNGSPALGYNSTWLARLESRNVKIAEVLFNKVASNDRELSANKGEHLEIIDDSRNWWKARNAAGNIGYVPHTILTPYNFEPDSSYSVRDNDSICSSILDNTNEQPKSNANRKTLAAFVPTEQELKAHKLNRNSMPRSISMPNVPAPPPMPPPSEPGTPSGTLKRNMAINGGLAAMRARNDCEAEDNASLTLPNSINDELKFTLLQRERRKDMEILITPQIYISESSKPKEVEEWLRGKGFSDNIVKKLRGLTGVELFKLSPHVIEGYFGQKESRRLISQILLQKNICEYKTIRSSELNAKLARARQKVETENSNIPDEIF